MLFPGEKKLKNYFQYMNSNKKKILTITCHNVYNHGASLQEYALLQYLNSLGYEARTINYTPKYLSGHFDFFSVDNPKWNKNLITKLIYIVLKFPSKLLAIPRKNKFDKFSKPPPDSISITTREFAELKFTQPA